MSLSLQLWSPTKLRRAMCIACAPFILAFIAFNILDLDGSDLISLSKNFEISIFAGDVDVAPRIDPFRKPLERIDINRIVLAGRFSRYDVQPYYAEISQSSPIGTARDHGYRVGLARHSLPNAAPDL
jgi:hypothetical protein